MPPKRRIWRRATACPGSSERPGYSTCETAEEPASRPAMRSALSQWRSMRTASVLTPRSVRKQSSGAGTAPSEFCRKRSRSPIAASRVPAKPPTTSEWPPMYFVVEWTTMSAPSSSGCCR